MERVHTLNAFKIGGLVTIVHLDNKIELINLGGGEEVECTETKEVKGFDPQNKIVKDIVKDKDAQVCGMGRIVLEKSEYKNLLAYSTNPAFSLEFFHDLYKKGRDMKDFVSQDSFWLSKSTYIDVKHVPFRIIKVFTNPVTDMYEYYNIIAPRQIFEKSWHEIVQDHLNELPHCGTAQNGVESITLSRQNMKFKRAIILTKNNGNVTM